LANLRHSPLMMQIFGQPSTALIPPKHRLYFAERGVTLQPGRAPRQDQ